MEKARGTPARPVVFGEVLFDRFPDGAAILGGAPFNVAWHLKGFGLDPLFISRVGGDEAGDIILARMQHWGMDLRAVQRDVHYPTGAVEVHIRDGQPRFEILPDRAYDHIESESLLHCLQGQNLGPLYMGSLVSRGPVSRASLDSLLRRHHLPAFIDINLRAPWWELARVEGAMARARWAKLNDEELVSICGPAQDRDKQRAQAEILRIRFDLELLILTRGAEGAAFIYPGGELEGEPEPIAQVIDTVGAGDAFSAVTLMGLMRGWSREQILDRALAFAARICQQQGATADDAACYTQFREQWGL